eukprot:1139492-Pelagomonas_calceolata.AAC.4
MHSYLLGMHHELHSKGKDKGTPNPPALDQHPQQTLLLLGDFACKSQHEHIDCGHLLKRALDKEGRKLPGGVRIALSSACAA